MAASEASGSGAARPGGLSAGTSTITLDDRKTAMTAVLRGMYTDADFGSGPRTTSPGPAAPINPPTSVPIIGAAWTEQVHVTMVPTAGISILRNSVRKELDFLNRAEAKQNPGEIDSSPDVTISSNAPFLESMWKCVQHYVRTAPPLTDLSTSVPSSQPPKRTNGNPTPPTKIDVVAKGGHLWARLFTLKPSSLLQEFRLIEAEEADFSSDDDDQDMAAPAPTPRLGAPRSALADANNFAFDAAAERCSLVQTALDLCNAADRVSPTSGAINVHLILTRLDWPDSMPVVQDARSSQMRSFTEDERYRLRLHAILSALRRLPNLTIFTSSTIPFAQEPSVISLHLPSFAPRDSTAAPTVSRNLNLDLSALVALTSDIVHGDPIPASSQVDHARACFHTTAPYKASKQGGSKSNLHSGAHGRALAEQLWRECCQSVAQGGDFLHSLLHVPEGASPPTQVVFWTTRESIEKFTEIVDLVAGKQEARRAYALLGRLADSATSEREFWRGSRWESNATLCSALQVPIRIIDANVPQAPWTDPLSKGFAGDLSVIIKRSLRAQDEDLDFVGQSIRAGKDGASDQEASLDEAPSPNGPGPTPHTLRSLLAGCELGMTTLTTNFTSIKWLVRQWPSEQTEPQRSQQAPELSRSHAPWPTAPNSLGLIGKYYLSQDELASMTGVQAAVVWVLHPRSFAEQMRMQPPSRQSHGRHTRVLPALTPGTVAALTAPNGGSSHSNAEANAAGCESSTAMSSYPNRSPSSSEQAMQMTHRSRWRPSVPSWKAVGVWLQGPVVPERLVIRHYPWWPFGPVERRWLRLTAPVAWKDPNSLDGIGSGLRFLEGGDHADDEAHGHEPLAVLGSLRERGRAKARRGLRTVREGLPTWMRSAPEHHEAQIEMSPSPERSRGRMEDSADTAVELSGDEGLRRRHHRSDFEVTAPDALQPTLRSYEAGPSLPKQGLRPLRSGGFSTDSDQTADTQDMLLPIAEVSSRGTANGQQPSGVVERVNIDSEPADDFVGSVRRDVRLNWLHWLLLFVTCACWIIAFAVLAKSLWYESSVFSSSDRDAGEQAATFYGCTAAYWLRNAECGLDGQNCAPFTAESPAVFRCPQGCLGTPLGAPRAVGDQLPAWVPLIVGGGDANKTYRGDSWVCAAAAHAGVIDDKRGGCSTLTLTGTFSDFIGVRRNGADSVGFNSTFPLSYRFGSDVTAGKCTDRRGQLYVLDVIMSAFVGFVLRPKPIVWYWILVCVGYWHVNFASEPRDFPPPVGDAFGDFLPTLFACYAMWRVAFRFVWPHFSLVPLEREIWTLAAFWIGVLLNVVFADVPLSRLVGRDLASQPGSITALTIIIIVVIVLVVNQVRVIRKTTCLPRYLGIYVTGAIIVGLLAAIPGESLRLHHYIIALVLLPGCAFPTRLSLIYCAFLLGMMENGLGRWGFDGLIQDVATVIGDGTQGTGRPVFLNSSTNWAGVNSSSPPADGILAWAPLNTSDPEQQGYDSFNLLVDDVLRYSGTGTTFNLSTLFEDFSPSNNSSSLLAETIRSEPHYLRLAFASGLGSTPGDFTRAAIAYFNGTFVDAPDGAT